VIQGHVNDSSMSYQCQRSYGQIPLRYLFADSVMEFGLK